MYYIHPVKLITYIIVALFFDI